MPAFQIDDVPRKKGPPVRFCSVCGHANPVTRRDCPVCAGRLQEIRVSEELRAYIDDAIDMLEIDS